MAVMADGPGTGQGAQAEVLMEAPTIYQMVLDGVIDRFSEDHPCTCHDAWVARDLAEPGCFYHEFLPWLETQRDLP
jgi:hypothetical protein